MLKIIYFSWSCQAMELSRKVTVILRGSIYILSRLATGLSR